MPCPLENCYTVLSKEKWWKNLYRHSKPNSTKRDPNSKLFCLGRHALVSHDLGLANTDWLTQSHFIILDTFQMNSWLDPDYAWTELFPWVIPFDQVEGRWRERKWFLSICLLQWFLKSLSRKPRPLWSSVGDYAGNKKSNWLRTTSLGEGRSERAHRL